MWTTWRKLLGNLVPALICLPLGVAALLAYDSAKPLAPAPLLLSAAMPIVGWLALNLLAPLNDAAMRREAMRAFGRARPLDRPKLIFVGLAREGYQGLLDPHEDVGLLALDADGLRFYGEVLRLEIARSQLLAVKRAPNPHSLLMLGGWVVLEAALENGPKRLFIEPRERPTLLGNRRLLAKLQEELQAYIDAGAPAAKPSAPASQRKR